MLDGLTEKFTGVFKKLRGYGKLTESNIETALREVRLALLEADVHVSVVKSLLEKIKARALGQEVLASLTPHQQFLKIVHEELINLLGGQPKNLVLHGKEPHVILMVGLQGSGKTTSSAKLANHFKKKGRRPFLVPADVQRPAAIEQLKTLARSLDIPCFDTQVGDKPVKLVKKAVDEAKDRFLDIVIIDTAGRLHIDAELMDELKGMHKKLDDAHVLFVADAMTGQEAVRVTKSFHDLLKLDGVILTKLDGDARGGAVLSIQDVAQCPIYFTGVGEKTEDLEPFYPDRLVSRLLDQGDIMSLIEKAGEVIDAEEAKAVSKKLLKNQFTIEDFKGQLQQMKKLGSMKSLMGMLPGGKAMAQKVDMDQAEKELKRKEAIIDSMTRKERLHPEILNGSRRLRIAQGSGTQVSEVNRFIKEFEQMQKMFRQFSKGGLKNLKGMLGM